ncbi:Uncharacterized protein APZ42_033324 [Daphnia magna]|uniref:RNase H type-1 domain-containing protein n=1 Tax=Daphnia magna TaxID=35525 RepID=A0A164L746_9CRUS|nr:Uncharacterized protein APZ42_033324 [Daphnia magna]
MSAASIESSASVLRQRALFSSVNPPRGNSPIDSRVSVPDQDILSILLNSVRSNSRDRDSRPRDGHARNNSTQRDRDNRPRDGHARSNSTQRDQDNHPRGSPSRSRSRSIPRSRTRSASRIRSRSRSPNVVAAAEKTFNIYASKSRQVRKWLVQGLPNSEAKALRLNFKPVFDSSFDLFCPKLDESMERKWLRAKNLPKLKNFQETMLKSIQYQMMDSMRPMLHAWNQMRVDDPLLNSVESSLRLMGSAFANVSKLRRENAGRVKLRDLAKVMGNFSWAIPSVSFAQGHFRNLQNFYLSQAHGDLNKIVFLTEPAKADLVWWASHLKLFNGKSFFPDNPNLVIFSDASLTGWGAVCDGSRSRGPWTKADADRHINELELLTAYFSLQAFANASESISIQLFLDNSTAFAYINKCRGTHSRALSIIAAQIIQ